MKELINKEFLEKLYFYYPEKIIVDPISMKDKTVPKRNEPLPDWAKFFVRVGLVLAKLYKPTSKKESLVISAPCRDFAASLINFGIIKGYSDSLGNSGLETHYKNLTLLTAGASLHWRKGNRLKPAKYITTDQNTGAIIVKTQANKQNTKKSRKWYRFS